MISYPFQPQPSATFSPSDSLRHVISTTKSTNILVLAWPSPSSFVVPIRTFVPSEVGISALTSSHAFGCPPNLKRPIDSQPRRNTSLVMTCNTMTTGRQRERHRGPSAHSDLAIAEVVSQCIQSSR